MAQLFHSRAVVNSILFVGKTWNFTKKDSIIDLTVLVQYIKACSDIVIKTSKYCLLYYQLWKMFLSAETNLEVIETVAQNSSLKNWKICKKIPRLESLFLNKTKREKRKLLHKCSSVNLIFFRIFSFEGSQLMAASEGTI